ncbi:conserved hypothetical protein [Candidatus Sulfopaludibacter sp. SbA3]|nr:conserved hypothetical protein [Candidatus Sulfopaludibacter sp. SbA3]
MVPDLMWKSFKLSAASHRLPITAEWIGDLSVERYRPMLRLLDESDLQFLSGQPGFDREMAARLRAQRCHIFGCYLNSLRDDFRQTCQALRVLMVHSSEDRPDLAALLLRRQMLFGLCLVRARWRLLLYRWGMGCVDIRCLMKLFDSVCVELQRRVLKPRAGQA